MGVTGLDAKVNWLAVNYQSQSNLDFNFNNIQSRVHRLLKVIAFNANGIWRQRYELSKQLQDLHIDVALLSETHLKSHEGFLIPNYHFYRADRFPRIKGIPHKHVHLCYMCSMYTWQRWNLFIRGRPILSPEKMLT
jgi:hypothetical protein